MVVERDVPEQSVGDWFFLAAVFVVSGVLLVVWLGGWLAAQGFNPWGDHAHAHEGSRDQFYWRYGYFMGLNQALAMFTTRGATVH